MSVVQSASQFVIHLQNAGHLRSPKVQASSDSAATDRPQDDAFLPLGTRKLWELTDLSASEFADEAVRFHKLSRVTLQEMLKAAPLVSPFSQRFLRETLIFPYQSADGRVLLAVADPTDLAARRAAEIVLGPAIEIRIAAFDDLAVVLDQRLAGDGPEDASEIDGFRQPHEDDIESLRDLASGAPVVRAVNDLLEKAIELRASDIHIEPFQTVLPILPKDRGLLVVDRLGFATADEARLRRLLKLPHGMIVITGPTGSGKTTTLATILSILNEPVRKILTIEDPVEYEIPGINQSQIKPAIGLTFASALRSFVRQDPDVIMVGEVRDSETAHVAVHAALTGHLVLTTLHTETAAAALPRLLDLGVEAYLLRSTLRAVIAQRLVRQLCERCKSSRILCEEDFADDPRLATLGFRPGESIYAAAGCERCGGHGYRGRLGVFEVLELNDELRALIGEKTDGLKIDQA